MCGALILKKIQIIKIIYSIIYKYLYIRIIYSINYIELKWILN